MIRSFTRLPFGLLVGLVTVIGALLGSARDSLALAGPVHIKGARQTLSGNQDARTLSWKKEIAYLDKERTPFLQVLSHIKTRPTDSSEFKVFERDHPSRWTRINFNSGYNTTDASIVVDDGSMFRVDDIVLIPRTRERLLVTAISSNTLSVTRGVVGSTAAAIVDNDWLKILYSREEENGLMAEIVTTDVTTLTNFTQIFKRTYGQSRTDRKDKKRIAVNLAEDRRMAMGLIKEDMEAAFLFGKKREEASSGSIIRYTGGIDEFVTTNRIDMEGGIGFGDIGYLMNVATRYGGSRKIWICGRDARQQIDSLGLPFLQIRPTDNKMGMAVEGFRTSFGEAMLLTHHGLDNALAGHIFVIDPDHCAIAELDALDHHENIQENDRDGQKNEFLAELGLWLDTEKAHMVITGVTAKVI